MSPIKKITALFLSALLLTALLAGCGAVGAKATPTPAVEEDLVYQLTGLNRDTALFTVDGAEVTAEEYLFWLSQSVGYMDQYAQYLGESGINWEQELEGLSVADFCKNDAMETSKLYALIALRAGERGCVLSAQDTQSAQEGVDSMIEQLGGRETYELWLQRAGLTEERFNRLNEISYLYENLQDALYGEAGETPPDAARMDAYIAQRDLLAAKHILLLTVDMNNPSAETGEYAKLADEVVAQKRKQAEELLTRLRGSGQPAALFDTLMNEYSEDGGLSANPNGYQFTAGQMVTEFETAVRTLEFGEISGIVESVFGYHIILRQDPDTETLRGEWINEQMTALMEQWVTNAAIETTDAYDALDVQEFYTRLLAHQAEIDGKLKAEASGSATAG